MKYRVTMLLFFVAAVSGLGRMEGQVNWTPRTPFGRCCMGMAFHPSDDPTRSGMLLFGGFDSATGQYFGDTWIRRLGAWALLTPSNAPASRQGPGMAYDGATGTIVLFGGTAANGSDLNDTWIWDGSAWTQVVPPTSPPGRRFDTQGMAYDATTQSVVMFGGYSNATNTVFGDTWTWNGRTKSWTQQNPLSSPSPRRAPIAYDGARGQVVLFGGDDPSVGTIFPDTWTWNGTTWKQQSPVVSPSQRGLASLAYDASLAKVLLFGGFIPGFCPNDTWAWDGSGWSAVSTVRAPVGRFAFGMASNPATNGVVLFGGFGCGYTLGDTWAVSPGD